jgi:hypothetical protein
MAALFGVLASQQRSTLTAGCFLDMQARHRGALMRSTKFLADQMKRCGPVKEHNLKADS